MKNGLLVTALLLATACSKGTPQTSPEQASGANDAMQTAAIEKSRVPVQTQSIALRAVQNTYRASAALEAVHDVGILLSVGETVATVERFTGDRVKAGDVIATLVSPELQVQLQTAKVEADEAKRLHGISEQLFQENHIARDR